MEHSLSQSHEHSCQQISYYSWTCLFCITTCVNELNSHLTHYVNTKTPMGINMTCPKLCRKHILKYSSRDD